MKLYPALENLLGEIALGGVGDDHGDTLAGAELFGELNGSVNGCAGAGAGDQTLFGGKTLDHRKGIVVADHRYAVADIAVKGLGNEVDADAFDPVLAGRAALQY